MQRPLTDKSVIQAIREGPNARVALIYVEWAGWNSQRVIVPWTVISNGEDAQAFAAKLTAEFNSALRRTLDLRAVGLRRRFVRDQPCALAAPGDRHLG